MGTDLNIGHVTAYAYAKSKGYTGTEEQFATELAQFAQNAQRVAEDRAAVERLVDEFLNTTAPAVIQDVTDEGTSQVERVAGAGTAQVTRVGQAGNTQIDAVAAAGTTQTGLVTAEGTTQVTRVQDKGDEVIDSIPADYTALTQEVSDLNQQLSDLVGTKATWDAGKTRDLPNVLVQSSYSGWASVLVEASEGDVFYVKGSGGNNSRLWVFADSTGASILASETNIRTLDYVEITAPAGTAYLACNSRTTDEYVPDLIIGVPISFRVDKLEDQTSDLDDVVIEHPTTEFLKVDVRSGTLQANGTYDTASDGFGVGYKIPLAPNGKITITPYGPEGFKYIIRFVAFAEGETSGTLTQTGVLTDESYTFTQPTTKAYLMFCLYYKHTDESVWNDVLNEFSDTDILVKTEIITEVLPLARLDDLEPVQNQITEQAETLEFDHSYLNILQGASTFEDNKFINQNGLTISNSNFCLIDGYYPVKPNTTYKLYRDEPALYSNAGHNWTFWNENKSFISYTLSGQPVTSPANAAYLRFAVYISSTGSATHQDFDPTKVIITEDGNPFFDDIFIKTSARPTFNGLKWIGIGDSITEDNFRATYHYWSYIAAETGLNFVNMGVSGTGYKAEGSGDKAFYKRVPSMATDADVITIFGGVNDVVLSSATIGTETDTGTETICGCVNATLDAIETLYPAHMPIGIISPLPCYCSDTTVNIHPYQQPNDDTCRMAQFVEQLALICKHRGIPFLDLFHQSNLRPWHQECNAKYFSCDSATTGDGLHPNGHGHRLFYRQIMDFVQKIVMQ